MIAVCNTSPISSLIQIEQLALLERLFTELWIPPEVAAELDEGAEFLGDWRTAPGAASIRARPIQNQPSSGISQVASISAKRPRSP